MQGQVMWSEEYQQYGAWALSGDGHYLWYPTQARCCPKTILSLKPSFQLAPLSAASAQVPEPASMCCPDAQKRSVRHIDLIGSAQVLFQAH